ncbi:hypothetical protein KR044_006440 [Drosophila immigrans]|nr:hypothetical protein KR044_006440 [Drosophila immigrans]
MEMVKRAFLRACINRSSLDHDLIDNILSSLCAHYETTKPQNEQELRDFVVEINDSITKFNQSLTFVKHPISGKEYLVFAITDATPDKHSYPGMTAAECQYFAMILDKLGHEEDGHIAWNEAYAELDFKGTARPPSKQRMQTLIQQWAEMGYLLEDHDKLYFGPRSLVEFEFYLRFNFPDTIKPCHLCKQLVLWDIKCSDCGRKIHRDCIRKYLRTRSNCPTCGKKWTTRLSQ